MYVVIQLYALIYRNKRGRVVKPAPFQSSAASGDVARIEPNKKWFGKAYYFTCKMFIVSIQWRELCHS